MRGKILAYGCQVPSLLCGLYPRKPCAMSDTLPGHGSGSAFRVTLLRGPTTQAQLESGRSQAQACPPGIHGPVGCRTQVSPVVSVAGRRNSHSSGRSKKSMLCFHRTKALGGSRLGGYSFRNKRMGDLSQRLKNQLYYGQAKSGRGCTHRVPPSVRHSPGHLLWITSFKSSLWSCKLCKISCTVLIRKSKLRKIKHLLMVPGPGRVLG